MEADRFGIGRQSKKSDNRANSPHDVHRRQLNQSIADICGVPTINWKSPKRPWITSSAKPTKSQSRSPHATDDRYHTTRWRRLRAEVLRRWPLCSCCVDAGRVTPARVVDHVIRVRDGGSFWDINNLAPMCDRCHNAKSGAEAHGGKGSRKSK